MKMLIGQGGINISNLSAGSAGNNEVDDTVRSSTEINENLRNNLVVRRGLTSSRENIGIDRYETLLMVNFNLIEIF